MQIKPIHLAVLFASSIFAMVCAQAQTAIPQQTLQQYVADLQSNPNDAALRGKIIALAQTMRPAPAIPEEAREHYVMAATFMESAKDPAGFARAVEQYKAALLVAPWWADAYKKLAIARKAAAQYDDAMASLNLYLLTQPSDARDAQDEIYKIKALKQAAADEAQRRANEERARENSPEAIAARKQAAYDAWLKSLDGARYIWVWEGGSFRANMTMDIHGNKVTFGLVYTWASASQQSDPETHLALGVWHPLFNDNYTRTITGRTFQARYVDGRATISEDGNSITETYDSGQTYVFQRQ